MTPEKRLAFYALAMRTEVPHESSHAEAADHMAKWVNGDEIRFRALELAVASGRRSKFDQLMDIAQEFATYAEAEPKPLTGKGSGRKRGPYKSRADKSLATKTNATAAA
ncbi:MAG: hypothetical protein V3V08_23300 [Nannocystaceae bacterium]